MAAARSLAICTLWILVGCFASPSAPGGDDDGGPLGGALTVRGTVVDFQTRQPIAAAATVQTSGLLPAPTATLTGADFEITNIPENSAFQILAAAPPSHRATFGPSVYVVSSDLAEVQAPVLAESYLAGLATAFQVTPTAAKGVLLARVVDGNGAPKAGVAANNFVVAGGSAVAGPYFLDANLTPQRNLTATSASAWVVFFEVAPGVVSMGSAAQAAVTLDMPDSPSAAATVTIAEIKATDGAPQLPKNVSLANDVLPVFANRGCFACHKGSGVGTDLAGLSLNGGAPKVFGELTQETTPARAIAGMPDVSKVITMPSREDPPDRHPNVTFQSANDPDRLKIYVWIKEGAKNN